MIHAGNIERCERLQRILAVLADFGWHTNRELLERTGVHAYSTAASELRANGYPIQCRPVPGMRGLYEYRMLRPAGGAP